MSEHQRAVKYQRPNKSALCEHSILVQSIRLKNRAGPPQIANVFSHTFSKSYTFSERLICQLLMLSTMQLAILTFALAAALQNILMMVNQSLEHGSKRKIGRSGRPKDVQRHKAFLMKMDCFENNDAETLSMKI